MKIIDWEKKGNLVRFYLGDDDCNDSWGDDFDDAPYDCNAGRVYCRYIKGWKDVVFPFEFTVKEPCEDNYYNYNCPYSKEDIQRGKVPCIVAGRIEDWNDGFSNVLALRNSQKFYFYDKMEPDVRVHLTDDGYYLVDEATGEVYEDW